ncbi:MULTISPECIES: sulfate adenylyltransferase [unclassified Campylobacter]|uniref:sulfate adenylyltransferase n=1 Tax=unclassified Campylobacter TaxID=2593542 RepID=UPI001BD99AFD|nr:MULTISPECIES: sulfate adenylyltransferase [unclassified Campylobacter]MBZ7976650.1 sulfate adenylyltransferase [Campylobacter sp. RM12637]MBZ7978304.1 sulfate adenylyltransferase [Campylobacter sp. RM12654]MBZ7981313.1 sulfate adenylyltransferase [Campylobacter sp. RM12640]MBZ7989144.1 sulfate adenylyltransferase [Campylobacter sp. RM12635]MBZ8007833.1 sulfate adenylyltransferase [Campylobacter sp. RM9334]
MESIKNKIKEIKITEKELSILSLIEINSFNTNGYLPNKEEVFKEFNSATIDKNISACTLAFSPNYELNDNIKNYQFNNEITLILNDKKVGKITQATTFDNDKAYTNIFSANTCKLDKELNPCIAGKVEIFNNEFKKVKTALNNKIKKNNAKKITALILNADPITRAHERMLRWTIDKADLVIIFVVEGYDTNSLNFQAKKECFEYYAKNFLPLERIFPVYLKNIDLFSPYLDPNYECLLASSFGANKLVIGQNHQGLGLFYDNNLAHTAIDELSKKTGLELIVLPEFVFCNKCNVMVSTKSCPHGAHHHIKYRSSMIREMLHSGLIPPTVLVRKEISAKLLAHLHPNRFKNVQMIYDGLFPSNGIIEKRSDEDLYKELITLYQTSYMI